MLYSNYKKDLRNLYAGLNRQEYLRTGQLPKLTKVNPKAKTYKGKTYRSIQHRNTVLFNSFSKEIQRELRELGYNNVGWDNVKESWRIMWRYFN